MKPKEEFVSIGKNELDELSYLIYDRCRIKPTDTEVDMARRFISACFDVYPTNKIRKTLFNINDELPICRTHSQVAKTWSDAKKRLIKEAHI